MGGQIGHLPRHRLVQQGNKIGKAPFRHVHRRRQDPDFQFGVVEKRCQGRGNQRPLPNAFQAYNQEGNPLIDTHDYMTKAQESHSQLKKPPIPQPPPPQSPPQPGPSPPPLRNSPPFRSPGLPSRSPSPPSRSLPTLSQSPSPTLSPPLSVSPLPPPPPSSGFFCSPNRGMSCAIAARSLVAAAVNSGRRRRQWRRPGRTWGARLGAS
ncbi:hypothetical protein MRB53_015824 [Persea americana]|uniref:Uncharacterized protein n=1 Tax=Persea americana TaxID=3435 RepID=A0ACC2M0F0_PERAE|nr:hypothetical protein MRB53_015824 [Persea americana]